MEKVEMTLCYFLTSDKILLPLKKKKIGKGKHNGVGGRLEIGETHEKAMIRECIEEVGLCPTEYDYVAELNFEQPMNGKQGIAIVHVYLCTEWTGELIETEEMKPFWFNKDNIPFDKTMDDDKYFLPLLLDGKKLIATFQLDENYITQRKDIKIVETMPKNKQKKRVSKQ